MIKKHTSAPSLVMVGTSHLSISRLSSGLSSEFSDVDSVSSEISEPAIFDSQSEFVSYSGSEISPGSLRRSREKKKKRPAPQPPGRSVSMRNISSQRPTFVIVNQASTDSESQNEFGFSSRPNSNCLESPDKEAFSNSPHVSPRERSRLRAFKDALKSPRNIRKNSKKYKPEKDEVEANGFKVTKNATIEPPEFSDQTYVIEHLEFEVDSEFEVSLRQIFPSSNIATFHIQNMLNENTAESC